MALRRSNRPARWRINHFAQVLSPERSDAPPLPEPVRKYTLTDEPLSTSTAPDGRSTSIVRAKRYTKDDKVRLHPLRPMPVDVRLPAYDVLAEPRWGSCCASIATPPVARVGRTVGCIRRNDGTHG